MLDKSQYTKIGTITLALSLFFSACSILSPNEDIPIVVSEPTLGKISAPEETAPEQPPSKDLSETQKTPGSTSSAERQAVTFSTSDGRSIEGYFYPPREDNSPIIVLMHWSPGTLDDWNQIALWLQNRQNELTSEIIELDTMVSYSPGQNNPWQDPSWFPQVPPEFSVGVLTFNFGGRGNSQAGSGGEGLILDAIAAVTTASTLQGIDPHKISTMGASIGAHASLNACQSLNQLDGIDATCVGALSLSPGDALGIEYDQSAAQLRVANPNAVIYCFAAANDGSAFSHCLSAGGTNFVATAYEGNAHGMNLINPSFSPNPLFKLLEFFEVVYGMDLIN